MNTTDKPKCTAADGTTEVHNMPGVGLVVSAAAFNALVRDAERYRWLRNEADYLRLPQGSPQVLMTDEWGEPISTGKEAYPQKDGLDAAIDTAMQEKQP